MGTTKPKTGTSARYLTILVLSSLLVIAIAFTSGCDGVATATQLIEDIAPQEAFTLIQDNQANPDLLILDVRTPEEFAVGHIEDALNIDYYHETFRDELDDLDRNKTYLVYCRTGNRSQSAINLMEELGFREVYHLAVGITGWEEEGLPVTK